MAIPVTTKRTPTFTSPIPLLICALALALLAPAGVAAQQQAVGGVVLDVRNETEAEEAFEFGSDLEFLEYLGVWVEDDEEEWLVIEEW